MYILITSMSIFHHLLESYLSGCCDQFPNQVRCRMGGCRGPIVPSVHKWQYRKAKGAYGLLIAYGIELSYYCITQILISLNIFRVCCILLGATWFTVQQHLSMHLITSRRTYTGKDKFFFFFKEMVMAFSYFGELLRETSISSYNLWPVCVSRHQVHCRLWLDYWTQLCDVWSTPEWSNSSRFWRGIFLNTFKLVCSEIIVVLIWLQCDGKIIVWFWLFLVFIFILSDLSSWLTTQNSHAKIYFYFPISAWLLSLVLWIYLHAITFNLISSLLGIHFHLPVILCLKFSFEQ